MEGVDVLMHQQRGPIAPGILKLSHLRITEVEMLRVMCNLFYNSSLRCTCEVILGREPGVASHSVR